MTYKNAFPSKSQKTKSVSALSVKTVQKKGGVPLISKKKHIQPQNDGLYDIMIKGLKSEIEILENANQKLRQLSSLK